VSHIYDSYSRNRIVEEVIVYKTQLKIDKNKNNRSFLVARPEFFADLDFFLPVASTE